MECWKIGKQIVLPTIPLFHCSIIPFSFSETSVVKFFVDTDSVLGVRLVGKRAAGQGNPEQERGGRKNRG